MFFVYCILCVINDDDYINCCSSVILFDRLSPLAAGAKTHILLGIMSRGLCGDQRLTSSIKADSEKHVGGKTSLPTGSLRAAVFGDR